MAAMAITLVLILALSAIPKAQQMRPLPAHWVYKLDILTEPTLAERRATHEVVLIQFAVPWCFQCLNVLNDWRDALAKIEEWNLPSGTLTFGVIDAERESSLVASWNVSNFPHILFFVRSTGQAGVYYGSTAPADILKFVKAKAYPISSIDTVQGLLALTRKGLAKTVAIMCHTEVTAESTSVTDRSCTLAETGKFGARAGAHSQLQSFDGCPEEESNWCRINLPRHADGRPNDLCSLKSHECPCSCSFVNVTSERLEDEECADVIEASTPAEDLQEWTMRHRQVLQLPLRLGDNTSFSAFRFAAIRMNTERKLFGVVNSTAVCNAIGLWPGQTGLVRLTGADVLGNGGAPVNAFAGSTCRVRLDDSCAEDHCARLDAAQCSEERCCNLDEPTAFEISSLLLAHWLPPVLQVKPATMSLLLAENRHSYGVASTVGIVFVPPLNTSHPADARTDCGRRGWRQLPTANQSVSLHSLSARSLAEGRSQLRPLLLSALVGAAQRHRGMLTLALSSCGSLSEAVLAFFDVASEALTILDADEVCAPPMPKCPAQCPQQFASLQSRRSCATLRQRLGHLPALGACPIVPTMLLLRAEEHPEHLHSGPRDPIVSDVVPLAYVYPPTAREAVTQYYQEIIEVALNRFHSQD